MISLKRITGGPKYFESAEIAHPEQTGTNYVEYTITHNFGLVPDLTRTFTLVGGIWREWIDLFISTGPTNIGYANNVSNDLNKSKVKVYRVSAGTNTIKFRFFYL